MGEDDDNDIMDLEIDLTRICGEGDIVIDNTMLRIHDWLGGEYERLIVSISGSCEQSLPWQLSGAAKINHCCSTPFRGLYSGR